MFYLSLLFIGQKFYLVIIAIITIIVIVDTIVSADGGDLSTPTQQQQQRQQEQYTVQLLNDSIQINSSIYHKWIRPLWNTGIILEFFFTFLHLYCICIAEQCVNISVNMKMDPIATYKDIESLLEIQAIYEFHWNDSRLTFSCEMVKEIIGTHYFTDIWTPNLRVSRVDDIDVFGSKTLSKLTFLRIGCDGDVSIRYRYVLYCIGHYYIT